VKSGNSVDLVDCFWSKYIANDVVGWFVTLLVMLMLCFSASRLLSVLASDAATLLGMRSRVLDCSGLTSDPALFQRMSLACPVACI